MSCDEHGEECQYECGYHGAGKDLAEHERHEHADCPRCGAKAPLPDEDGLAYSVTHRSDCPRLVPGHRYEDEHDGADPHYERSRRAVKLGEADDGLPRVPLGGATDQGFDAAGGAW